MGERHKRVLERIFKIYKFMIFTTCTDLFLCENKLWTLSVNLTLIIFIIIPMPKEGRKYNSAERIDLRLI